MKKYLSPLLLLVCCGLIAFQPHEDKLVDRLNAYLQQYQAKRPQEKLFIHLDRPAYHLGDTIWTTGYLLNLENQLWDLSKIVHLQLENQAGEAVKQWQLPIEKGKITGSLTLPADLTSGLYRLRAFTQWMRNFGAAHFFSTYLPIYGNEDKQAFAYKPSNERIRISAEGGQLVRKLICRLSIQTYDSEGMPASAAFRLVDEADNVLEKLASDTAGQASVEFDPQFGKNYYVVLEGDNKRVPVIGIQDHGTVLRVNSNDPNEITVLVQSNEPMRDATSRDGLLVVYAKGQIYYAANCSLGKSRFVANFPTEGLPPGIVEVVIFDGKLRSVAERCIFQAPLADQISLPLPQKAYRCREKINIPIRASRGFIEGNYSLTIRRKHPTQESTFSMSPFFFNEIQTSFIPPELQERESIDIWLMGQKSKTNWAAIVQDDFPKPQFLVQQQPVLRGQVMRNHTPAPVCKLDAFVAEHHYLYEIETDELGAFDVAMVDFADAATLFFVPEETGDPVQVILDQEKGAAFQLIKHDMTAAEQIFWQQQAIRLEAQEDYRPDTKIQRSRNQLFYSQADLVVRPDDYIPLPSMIEVFREIVPPVQVKGNAGNFRLRVVPEKPLDELLAYDQSPLLLVDGWPTFDPKRLLSLSPSEVDRIEVLHLYASLKRLGRVGLHGAIAVFTRSGDFRAGNQDLIFPDYPGLHEAADFHTPAYMLTKEDKEPDFRATAHWQAEVKLDATGKADLSFYIGDDVGEYEIELQGMSGGGVPVAIKNHFSVKR